MEVIFNLAENVLIAELLGELDHHAAPKVREDIDHTMESFGVKDLIFDFSKVSYMDSSGIGMVLGRYRRLNQEGGHIIIVSCSDSVKAILNMAGIFSLMEYMDSKDEAVRTFINEEVS